MKLIINLMNDAMSAITNMESETYGADDIENIEHIDASSVNSLESELSSIGNLKTKLSSLCNSIKLNSNESGKQRFETLLYRKGKRPIRMALVVDVKAGVLITLWCLGVVKRSKNRSQKNRSVCA